MFISLIVDRRKRAEKEAWMGNLLQTWITLVIIQPPIITL